MALAGPATAYPVNGPIPNVDPVPKAHVPPASGYLPHYLQHKVEGHNAEKAEEIAEKKDKKQPENTMPESKFKPQSSKSSTKGTKRDVQPHEEAAGETTQALEARSPAMRGRPAPKWFRKKLDEAGERKAAREAEQARQAEAATSKPKPEPEPEPKPAATNPPKKAKPSKKSRERARKNAAAAAANSKRDVREEEAADEAAAAVLEEPHARLEARVLGPHVAVGPYINRQIKKAKQRVAAHDATVRNNRLNEPKREKPKGE